MCKCGDGYHGLAFGVSGPVCDKCRGEVSTSAALRVLSERLDQLSHELDQTHEALYDLGYDSCFRCGEWHKKVDMLLTLDRRYCLRCWGEGLHEDEEGENLLSEADQLRHNKAVVQFLVRRETYLKKSGIDGERILSRYLKREPYLTLRRKLVDRISG